MSDNMQLIEKQLREAFSPTYFKLIDESHLHVGHAGAQIGKGHYALVIHSIAFKGKPPIQRHRMIYESLSELMRTKIHALSITAKP
ncbi:MAG: BolA family protein [Ostreibacterium sp.]